MPERRTHDLNQLPLERLLALGVSTVKAAAHEDLGRGDPTSEALFGDDDVIRAVLVARQRGVIAGLPVAERVFRSVDPSIQFDGLVEEGEQVVPGEVVAKVAGRTGAILAAERTALNFVQRMSGIATLTSQYASEIATTGAVLRDTRKTAPGLRALDKYAVRVGGGTNHRLALAELAMIKDTHIDAGGGIGKTLAAFREKKLDIPLEVEVRTPDELDVVLSSDPLPDRILLDNFEAEALSDAVVRINRRAVVEASGGVTLETIAEIASTGVDEISVGQLTHSPPAFDVSMEVRPAAGVDLSFDEIERLRGRLGRSVVLLVHHYIRDSVVEHADVTGDSLALARAATEQDADVIVFCGVRFMGETAAVLCREDQEVVMPVPSAGCFLADCADLDSIETAWTKLREIVDIEGVLPITYVNSSAELKAFCGRNGGTVCTSSNASHVLRWALARSDRVLFFPDRHLGTNAALAAGIPHDEIAVWHPTRTKDRSGVARARVIVWPGACNVHHRFRPEHAARIRKLHPSASVIVHPECSPEVVELADRGGSTSRVIEFVEAAPPATTIAIGTEAHLVRRLQRLHPNKRILHLADVPAFCRTMTETTPEDLLQTLRDIDAGQTVSRRISVDGETAQWARLALSRMLELPTS